MDGQNWSTVALLEVVERNKLHRARKRKQYRALKKTPSRMFLYVCVRVSEKLRWVRNIPTGHTTPAESAVCVCARLCVCVLVFAKLPIYAGAQNGCKKHTVGKSFNFFTKAKKWFKFSSNKKQRKIKSQYSQGKWDRSSWREKKHKKVHPPREEARSSSAQPHKRTHTHNRILPLC